MAAPNVFVFVLDQCAAQALANRSFAVTPNIDSLIDSGISFSRTYCTYPLCLPSRGSFWSGRNSHETGVTARGVEHRLVSLLDMVPTICGLVGQPVPEPARGIDLSPLLSGDVVGDAHTSVVSQWYSEWGSTIEPGRMLRTDRYRYIVYNEGGGEEFYDLEKDSGERINLIANPDSSSEVQRHRELFARYVEETDDHFSDEGWKADARWREYAPGYDNHNDDSCSPIEAYF